MRILAVNWLDRDNPQAGGAEIHFFEIFGRLVDRGHEVVLITSGWKGAAPRAKITGIEVLRFGGRHSFALRGRGAIRRALAERQFDVVVEDINKLPLFVQTLTELPVYAIVPHLFGTTAFREASFPVASLVWLAERLIPRLYRGAAFHAISESTRDDLVQRGIRPSDVEVVFPGVDTDWLTPENTTPRAKIPTFLYVGRLKRYKGIDILLNAMAALRRNGIEAVLKIVGRGDDLARLEGMTNRQNLGKTVEFLGFVDEEEKRTLLRQAWAVVFPSAKEGWGIVNVEAAACGTLAIASDSPGLRESVRDGQTGILVPHGDYEALAEALEKVVSEPGLVERLGSGARLFAETLSWDRAAELTEAHLLETSHRAGYRRKEEYL
ncbi:glycosyltransferase family 4 protein [Gemmatimonadota bacterium]